MRAASEQRRYNVAYYAAHRAVEIQRVRSRQISTLEFLRDLRRRPCADCGGTYPPWVMDFDHRDPMTKAFRLTTGSALLKSREELLAEIEKCDIVCSNCHAIRTYRSVIVSQERNGPKRVGRSARLAEKRLRWQADSQRLRGLRDVSCADCGQRFPFFVMQFDHREAATKDEAVTRMIGRAGPRRIMAEVAKCDVVCSNCHRIRTFTRRTRARIGELAGVTQLVEFLPSKQAVAGSSPVSRSDHQTAKPP